MRRRWSGARIQKGSPVADEEREKRIKRGPKGGKKNTPGKDHDRKSMRQKKKRFARLSARRRKQAEEDARKAWEVWDSLPDDVKTLRSDLYPKMPRPDDETTSSQDQT